MKNKIFNKFGLVILMIFIVFFAYYIGIDYSYLSTMYLIIIGVFMFIITKIVLFILKKVNIPDSPLNKTDFSYVLFTFYLVAYFNIIFGSVILNSDVIWYWIAPKLNFVTIIFALITFYTLIYRIKNKTLIETFSLYKFLISKNISNNRKIGIIAVMAILFYSILSIDFDSVSVRRTYLILNKFIYASVMYALIYYVTFYTEMLAIINDETTEVNLVPELKEYKDKIENINTRYAESIQEQLKSERMKSDLITNVSHDIRTPLTSIISYVDLLCEKKSLDDQAKEYIQILNKKSWRLNSLIDDLMDATRLSSGNKEVILEKLDLNELISQIEADFEEQISANNLTIVIEHDDSPVYICADSNSTSRVIENLYGNICKYAMPNTRVYIAIQEEADKVNLIFKNISKEQLNINADELVERFVRADDSRTTSGNGLGLYIAQSLMELMSGSLRITINGDLFVATLTFKASCTEELQE